MNSRTLNPGDALELFDIDTATAGRITAEVSVVIDGYVNVKVSERDLRLTRGKPKGRFAVLDYRPKSVEISGETFTARLIEVSEDYGLHHFELDFSYNQD